MATRITDEMRLLSRKAEQYQEQMRKRLEQIYRPGRGRMQGQANPGMMLDQGGFRHRVGEPISDGDVAKFIASSGGNPYVSQLRELQTRQSGQPGRSPGRALPSVSSRAKKAEQNLLKQLSDKYQSAQDEHLFQNESRYQQGLAELAWLRDRNMGRVENFGKAAKADLEERFAKNLANVTSSLSSRGLGNSTITSAFDAKNAHDLAREQQRLSEMVDDRAARYDQSLTGDLVGFVERRDDIAPDMSALTALAQAYGASGAGEVPPAVAPTSRKGKKRTPQVAGVSPWAAQRIAGSYQGMFPSLGQLSNPLGMVMGQQQAIGNMVGRPQATTSNTYPEVRPKQGPNARQVADTQALQQRIRNRRQADPMAGNYQEFRSREKQRRAQRTFQNNPLPYDPPEQNPVPIGSYDMSNFFQNGMNRRFGDFSGAPYELYRSNYNTNDYLNRRDIWGNTSMSPDDFYPDDF